jgi:hypothetical protein
MGNVSRRRGVPEVMKTRLRTIARRIRAYHRRQSLEWTRRIEAPSNR